MEALLALWMLSGLPDFTGHWIGPGVRVSGSGQVTPCESLDWRVAQFSKALRISTLTAVCGGETITRPGIDVYIRGDMLVDSSERTLGMFETEQAEVILTYTPLGSVSTPPHNIDLKYLPGTSGLAASYQIYELDGQTNQVRGQLHQVPTP